MQTGRLPGLSKDISRIVLGTGAMASGERASAFELLDRAAALGINSFDTAHGYHHGDGERILGDWMAAHQASRESLVLIGKGALPYYGKSRLNAYAVENDITDSLRRLRVDYLDVFLLHRDDESLPVAGIVDILHKVKEQGYAHAVGVSNWRHERVVQANRYAREQGLTPLVANSCHFSLAHLKRDPDPVFAPGSRSITGSEAERAFYRTRDVALLAWSALAHGFFVSERPDTTLLYRGDDNQGRKQRVKLLAQQMGVSPNHVALAYVLRQDMDVFAIVGTRSSRHLEDNVAAQSVALSAQQLRWLEDGESTTRTRAQTER